jgi:hypothetical protein
MQQIGLEGPDLKPQELHVGASAGAVQFGGHTNPIPFSKTV